MSTTEITFIYTCVCVCVCVCVYGHGNPLQYSGLENPMDRGASPVTAHRVTKNQT